MAFNIWEESGNQIWKLGAADHPADMEEPVDPTMDLWCFSEETLRTKGGTDWKVLLAKLVGLESIDKKCPKHMTLTLFRQIPGWKVQGTGQPGADPWKIDDPWKP